MYVKIHSFDADNPLNESIPGGKSHEIQPFTYNISSDEDEISIDAEEWEQKGTGDRGGIPKSITRRLTLRLNKSDLQKLLDRAISEQIVAFPYPKQLIEAIQSLNKVVDNQKGNITK